MPEFAVATLDDRALAEAAARAGVALRTDELRRIRERLGRDPTIVELHAFDAQWSEHCSYKSSRHHLKQLPTDGPDVVIGPGEDSGVVHLGEHAGERYGIVVAHESHNHPSQVVPFEGAATGIGGIVRDVLCMGAKVVAVADPLRFGRVEDPHSHQRYVARGAVSGIGAYGNAIGVPNIAGDVYFDAGFDDNCLVNVVALGIVKESEIVHSHAPPGADGWKIVLVGKATDPSGFGGASFSSGTLDAADAESNKGAVQVPDPFLKNVIMRASYRVFELLRERGLTVGFKDLGAGGIMGCSAEICASGGYGADIDLDAVNAAVPNLRPEVLAVGETQERLIWVLPPGIASDVLRIYNEEYSLPEVARNAGAVEIGTVTAAKRYVLRHRGAIVMDADIDFLTGSIRDELPYDQVAPRAETAAPLAQDAAAALSMLEGVLGHRDVCSREPLYSQYDGVVRGRTALTRFASDAGTIAPVEGSRLGMSVAVAGNPRYGLIDPQRAAALAVWEAMRRVIATGARPVGLTDCLNFGNPRKPDQYGAFVAAVDGLSEAARSFGVAFVSGNVSLYNESKSGGAVPASAIVGCIGALQDIAIATGDGLAAAGSLLIYAARTQNELGGSVAADVAVLAGSGLAPIDYKREWLRGEAVREAIGRGLIRSAKAVSDGGPLAAAVQMAFRSPADGLGLRVELGTVQEHFGESGGWLLEVAPESLAALQQTFERRHLAQGTDWRAFAAVTGDGLLAIGDAAPVAMRRLRALWCAPLAEVFA
ncbi:MAG: phosphoribosylformylglycinamidine synthase subunit PurL [Vulcanimicrobiaceae bacterium]